jgi:hypothetical protein
MKRVMARVAGSNRNKGDGDDVGNGIGNEAGR